jgi:hypothetical protein
MASFRDDPGHNAPEVNIEQQQYIYSVPDKTPAYALPPSNGYDHAPPVEPSYTHPGGSRKGWKRWWILAIIGILIALFAGLVGGFIGQAIQKGREPASSTSSSDTANSTSCAPTSPSNSTSNSTADIIGTIVEPSTGCNFSTSKNRNRISNVSDYNKIKYTTVCNSGWGGSPIIGFYTLTPSDCIEACVQYNSAGPPSENNGNQSCVGGGFIPRWTNQDIANKESIGAPYNCYLKSSADGITENDRLSANVEVVALCLDGKCNDAGS